MSWLSIEARGVALAAYDYGGQGDTVLLLHGLAGHAREWDETASWLTGTHRVVALEQRGHGRSERHPVDVSRGAFVDDAVAWMDRLALEQAAVVGQSLGGHTAFLVAARHPSRVSRLVVAEASPIPEPASVEVVRGWLDAWPTPFVDRDEAIRYFGGESVWAEAWTSGLESGSDGLHQAFDIERLMDALTDAEARSYWPEWSKISCPTLIVRAEGGLPEDVAWRMAEGIPDAQLVTITNSGHDLHLERPDAWREVLSQFMSSSTRFSH
jgi:pimeloyl-ACP methyl ester carboxylesterase